MKTTRIDIGSIRRLQIVDAAVAVIAEQVGLMPEDLTAMSAFMEPVGVQVYGRPSSTAAAMDQGLIDAGVPFTGKRNYLGGFSLADQRPDAAPSG